MSRIPFPWVIDELEKARRERPRPEQPRIDIPHPPPPDHPTEGAPSATRIIVIDVLAAWSPGRDPTGLARSRRHGGQLAR